MKFGPFTLSDQIGEGGFATVYKATGPGSGPVALKVLKDKFLDNKRVRRDFVKEATIQKQLTHENIARCYGLVRDGRRMAICMEFIEGGTFRSRAHGPEAFEQDLPILLQIAMGLGYLHSNGIVHLDLKPGNVLVDGQGWAKLIDFCLAFRRTWWNVLKRFLSHDVIPGSPSYMAPEVIRGAVPDPRADMYSLGVVTYWTLTGRLPFTGSARSILRDHARTTPVAPSRINPRVPPALEALVFRLLAKDPDSRLADIEEYCETLLAVGIPTGTKV